MASHAKTYEATLELTSLDDIFQTPELSPLDNRFRDYSMQPALEFIAGEIYSRGSYRQASVTFVVPGPLDHDVEEVRAGIRRWASAKASTEGHEVTATYWRGVRSLGAGLVMFVVLIALAKLTDDNSGDLFNTISKGLEVAAWVVLWFPIDTLAFSLWQRRLDRKSYTVVRDMAVTLEPVM